MFKKKYLVRLLKILFILYVLRVIFLSFNLYSIYPIRQVNTINNEDYYIQFDYHKEAEAVKLDSNNVSFVDYSKIKSLGVKNELSYNPITIGFMGLKYYQKYIESKSYHDKNIFISHANWLKANINKDGSWEVMHDKYFGEFKLKAPWCSALAQGFGISVLTRAFLLTKDSTYIETARNALAPYKTQIKQGGITVETKYGVFYEEYPVAESPNHVLNGFIYSLFGLYDLYRFDDNKEAKLLFDKGVETLRKSIHLYDKEYWTIYSLNKESNLKNHWNYSSPFYQKIHIAQLQGLNLITKDQLFLKYKNKFEKQNKSSWINFIIYPAYVAYVDFVFIYKLFFNKYESPNY